MTLQFSCLFSSTLPLKWTNCFILKNRFLLVFVSFFFSLYLLLMFMNPSDFMKPFVVLSHSSVFDSSQQDSPREEKEKKSGKNKKACFDHGLPICDSSVSHCLNRKWQLCQHGVKFSLEEETSQTLMLKYCCFSWKWIMTSKFDMGSWLFYAFFVSPFSPVGYILVLCIWRVREVKTQSAHQRFTATEDPSPLLPETKFVVRFLLSNFSLNFFPFLHCKRVLEYCSESERTMPVAEKNNNNNLFREIKYKVLIVSQE